MFSPKFWNARRVGWLFVLMFVLVAIGATLFTIRSFQRISLMDVPLAYVLAELGAILLVERGAIWAGFIAASLGNVMLTRLLQEAGERVLSRLGMIGFVSGAVLAVVAEVLSLATGELQPVFLVLVRVFVILAFLAQAAYGGALLQTRLVPRWVGWVTVIFSLGGLAALSWRTDIYLPGVHFLMPFLIGILLLKRR